MVRGQIALRSMGIGQIPVVNIGNACASGSSALNTGRHLPESRRTETSRLQMVLPKDVLEGSRAYVPESFDRRLGHQPQDKKSASELMALGERVSIRRPAQRPTSPPAYSRMFMQRSPALSRWRVSERHAAPDRRSRGEESPTLR